MADLKIGPNVDLVFGADKDADTVTGREAFEQRLSLRVIEYYYDIIAEVEPEENILEMLNLYTERVARRMDELQNIAVVNAEKDDFNTDLLEVTVIYTFDESFSFVANPRDSI